MSLRASNESRSAHDRRRMEPNAGVYVQLHAITVREIDGGTLHHAFVRLSHLPVLEGPTCVERPALEAFGRGRGVDNLEVVFSHEDVKVADCAARVVAIEAGDE